jgi:hypothetical protein
MFQTPLNNFVGISYHAACLHDCKLFIVGGYAQIHEEMNRDEKPSSNANLLILDLNNISK